MTSIDRETMLLDLLKRNPRNRMAFEYLMGYYLLNGRLDRVADNIGRLGAFGIQGIPRAYEDALAIYLTQSPRGADLHGRTVRDEAMARARRMRDLLARCGGSREQAYAQLDESDLKTYCFYYFFRTGARP